MAAETEAKPEALKKKKGGCLKGCLLSFLVLLLLIGAVSALVFDVPKKMGWVKGPGVKLVSLTHERLTAEAIVAEAETKGFKSAGVDVYVFPKDDSDEAVLFAVYDFSGEAALSQFGTYHPVVAGLVLLGGGDKALEHKITHVGADFRDEEGKHIMNIAVSTSDVRELTEGQITEAEFRSRLGKDVDLPNYFQRAVIPF